MTTLSLTITDPSTLVITGENLAVEVKAMNSLGIPAGSHGQRHELVAGPEDQSDKEPLVAAGAVASVSAPHSPSTAPAVVAVAIPQAPQAATAPHSSASSSQQADKAEAVPPPAVSAAPFNNPRCLNACHFAHSREACHECLVAWSARPRSARPKDEQIRLWAEANEAARAAV